MKKQIEAGSQVRMKAHSIRWFKRNRPLMCPARNEVGIVVKEWGNGNAVVRWAHINGGQSVYNCINDLMLVDTWPASRRKKNCGSIYA